MKKQFRFTKTKTWLLLSFLLYSGHWLQAHGAAGYSADTVKVLKVGGSFLAGYPTYKNRSAVSLHYHYGVYSLYGFQYDLGGGYLFGSDKYYIDASAGIGFLFSYFDLGLLQTIGSNAASAIQFGVSTFLYSNYDPFFIQLSLRSRHFFDEKESADNGFELKLQLGYNFNVRSKY